MDVLAWEDRRSTYKFVDKKHRATLSLLIHLETLLDEIRHDIETLADLSGDMLNSSRGTCNDIADGPYPPPEYRP